MRVLTAAHYWPPHVGGVEFEAREQSRRLVARGHELTVVSSRIADDRSLSFDDGFPVHKVAASNILEDRIRLPYPLFSPRLFSVMSHLARDVDVVTAHTHTFMSTIAAARAARQHSKPFVLIQNNPYIEYRFPLNVVQRTADATIARYTVGAADQLVAISNFTAEYLQRLAPKRRVTVMHLGTDVERFSPVDRTTRSSIRKRLDLPADAFVALTVRRLFFRNGLDTLLDAAERLRDRRNLHIVIGGSGPERNEIERRIDRGGLENVHLVGFIPDADLPDYYRAADVFVLPTRTAEGFGLVLMEAAASGIPSIATDSGAPRELIDDVVTGLLVAPGAPGELAEAIRRVDDSPDLLASMGRAALAKSAGFTWDRSIDTLECILTDAVAQHATRREGARRE
jgi:glycosyltransferase involved in cell wall biosynthesis